MPVTPDKPHFAFPFARPGVPTRNEVTNPSAEGGVAAPWTQNAGGGGGVAVDSSWSKRGTSSFRVQYTVPAGGVTKYVGITCISVPIPVTPGQQVSFRFDYKVTQPLANRIGTHYAFIRCNKIGGGTLDLAPNATVLPVVAGATGTAVGPVVTIPDGVSSCYLLTYSASSTAGDTFDMSFDAFAVSLNGQPAVYGDGTVNGWRWDGTPYASTSTLLRNVPLLEQDTPEHVIACLLTIAHCPVGFRLERPDFGIPWVEYRTQIDPSSSIEDALLELEPRADMTAIGAVRELLNPDVEGYGGAVARLTYEVEVDGG